MSKCNLSLQQVLFCFCYSQHESGPCWVTALLYFCFFPFGKPWTAPRRASLYPAQHKITAMVSSSSSFSLGSLVPLFIHFYMELDLLLPQLLLDTEYLGSGCNSSMRQVLSHPCALSFPINEMGIMAQTHWELFIQMAFKGTAGFSITRRFLWKVCSTDSN